VVEVELHGGVQLAATALDDEVRSRGLRELEGVKGRASGNMVE
jgi:hypothetical protein